MQGLQETPPYEVQGYKEGPPPPLQLPPCCHTAFPSVPEAALLLSRTMPPPELWLLLFRNLSLSIHLSFLFPFFYQIYAYK